MILRRLLLRSRLHIHLQVAHVDALSFEGIAQGLKVLEDHLPGRCLLRLNRAAEDMIPDGEVHADAAEFRRIEYDPHSRLSAGFRDLGGTDDPLHEIDASFNNTVKHVQSETVIGETTARYAVEMAEVVAGDEATLRERPPLSLLICTIAPLAQDDGGMESALVFAKAGLPVGFMSMATGGSTAPATVPGIIAVAEAADAGSERSKALPAVRLRGLGPAPRGCRPAPR